MVNEVKILISTESDPNLAMTHFTITPTELQSLNAISTSSSSVSLTSVSQQRRSQFLSTNRAAAEEEAVTQAIDSIHFNLPPAGSFVRTSRSSFSTLGVERSSFSKKESSDSFQQIGKLQLPKDARSSGGKNSARRRSFNFPSIAATHLRSLGVIFGNLTTKELLNAMLVCKQWCAACDLPVAHSGGIIRQVSVNLGKNPLALDQLVNSVWGVKMRDIALVARESISCDRALRQLTQLSDLGALRLNMKLDCSTSTLKNCFGSLATKLQVLEITQEQEGLEVHLASLTKLVKLSYVHLTNASVLEEMLCLEELHLTQTPCTEELMMAVRCLSIQGALTSFHYHSDTDPCDGLQALTSVQELGLSSANLKTLILAGQGPLRLSSKTLLSILALPKLIHLRCHYDLSTWMCQVTPASLRTLGRLEQLDVSFSSMLGMGPAELSPLLYCTRLRVLKIHSVYERTFDGSSIFPSLFHACSQLRELELDGLYPEHAEEWARLKALKHLNKLTVAGGGRIEKELMRVLASLPTFHSLHAYELASTFQFTREMCQLIFSSRTWNSLHIKTLGGLSGNQTTWTMTPNLILDDKRKSIPPTTWEQQRSTNFRLYHSYQTNSTTDSPTSCYQLKLS